MGGGGRGHSRSHPSRTDTNCHCESHFARLRKGRAEISEISQGLVKLHSNEVQNVFSVKPAAVDSDVQMSTFDTVASTVAIDPLFPGTNPG